MPVYVGDNREWLAAALGHLGWTEREEVGGEILIFNNPAKPSSPLIWDATGSGEDLALQLMRAGVTAMEWEVAVNATMPSHSSPYRTSYDL